MALKYATEGDFQLAQQEKKDAVKAATQNKYTGMIDARKAQLQAMKDKIGGYQPTAKLEKESYTPMTGEDITKQFDQQRQLLTGQGNTQKQQNLEAMRRRFAASGGLNSGAAIRAQEVAGQESDQKLQDSLAGLGAQEAAANQALKAQNKAGEENVAQRNLQRDLQNNASAFQDKVFNADQNSKLYALGADIDAMQLGIDENEFNKAMARFQASHTGGLFGGGGFLGLGIGNEEVNF